ncbi:MAG: hypothetical protein IPK50_07695 [Fibrobacterota bacterium]|nr:MAG: hypothetical protein IPK50_07695 [Fibrobacterota bacterium]
MDSIEIQDACPICTLTLAKNFIKIRINPTVGKEWLPKKTRPFLLADWAWMKKASEIVEQQTFPSGLDSLLVWMESSASTNPSCGYMSPYQDYKCLERWRPEIKKLVLQIQPTLPKDDPNFFRFVSYYRKNGKNQAFKDSLVTLRNKMKNELSLQKILKAQGRLTITP